MDQIVQIFHDKHYIHQKNEWIDTFYKKKKKKLVYQSIPHQSRWI